MKIANLIRKRPREAVATAIPATSATELGSRVAAVARIATVAVAKPDEGRVEGTAPSIQASYWLLHFLDREPREMFVAPPMTHADTQRGTHGNGGAGLLDVSAPQEAGPVGGLLRRWT